jgi:hypothetical protein
MDSQTHVELADKLLGMTQAPANLALLSLFPQIDRFPHTLHRVYAHTVFKAHALTETGLRVMQDDHYADPARAFDVRRFQEEKPRFLSYLSSQGWSIPALDRATFESAMMSYVSHVYLDTYNQPAQPFAPHSIYCSGQWKLWEKIGDFRLMLYTTPVITNLRSELFAHGIWDNLPSFTPVALIQAMMVRMCRLSLERIDERTMVPLAMGAMGLGALAPAEISAPLQFLEEFEQILNGLHLKHLATGPSVQVVQDMAAQARRMEGVAA